MRNDYSQVQLRSRFVADMRESMARGIWKAPDWARP